MADGLPDPLVRALWCDRYGYIWAGPTVAWRVSTAPVHCRSAEPVWFPCARLPGTRGNLWWEITRPEPLRDEVFTVYGRSEGWPSDEPTTAFQIARAGVGGFHESGLMLVSAASGGFSPGATAAG